MLTLRLILTLTGSWLTFGLAAAAVSILLPIPTTSILLDLSYCPPDQWEAVVEEYTHLYSQHQQQRLAIDSVVTFSNLGTQALSDLPSPTDVAQLRTFGRSANDERDRLMQDDPTANLLTCH